MSTNRRRPSAMLAIATVATMLGLASAGPTIRNQSKENFERIARMDKKDRNNFYRAKRQRFWTRSACNTPHQGAQECARRVRNGDIYACNSRGGVV